MPYSQALVEAPQSTEQLDNDNDFCLNCDHHWTDHLWADEVDGEPVVYWPLSGMCTVDQCSCKRFL